MMICKVKDIIGEKLGKLHIHTRIKRYQMSNTLCLKLKQFTSAM